MLAPHQSYIYYHVAGGDGHAKCFNPQFLLLELFKEGYQHNANIILQCANLV